MNTASICQYCGKPNLPNAIGGLCPECLLKAALASNTGATLARFTPPPPAEIAPHFPQLEILEPLGHGGMGAVYKARQPNLNRLVALKILPAAHTGANPGFAERFQREARALARLNHPNIVAVYEFGQTAGYHFLIMEFVEGASLRQVVRAQKLTAKEALQIIPQICEALQFAHDAGIVHRDIKPENILLDKTGRVKIADFGLAKILAPDAPEIGITQAGHSMGTPHYMAPEQVETPMKVDHRADIYSLGVVFYEMLTGELPIGRFSAPSQRAQIDFRLDEIVLRALEKDPGHRYQQASEVKREVQTFADRPAQPKRPVRGFAAATVALLCVVFILAANLISKSNRPRELELRAQRQNEEMQRISEGNQLKAAEDELSQLRLRYTEQHPEVIRQRHEIERLSKRESVNFPEAIRQMNSGTWRQALATAEGIAALPSEDGLALVRNHWAAVTNAEARQQFLKAFAFANHPHVMAILDLGLNDHDNTVQSWALTYLKNLAAHDYADDYSGAIKYSAARRDWLLDDILSETARAVTARLPSLSDTDLASQLYLLQESSLLRDNAKAFLASGLEEALGSIIEKREPILAQKALQAASNLATTPEWTQRIVLPLLAADHPLEIRASAAQAIGKSAGESTLPALLAAARDLAAIRSRGKSSLGFALGSAFAKIGSPKAIPGIIEAIKADNTYSTIYGLGYFALTPLTGVAYDAKHDGAWWADWWEKNKERFAPQGN